MQRQNDWFTGIDYYHNYREKEIVVERKIIDAPIQVDLHEQVEILYVLSGNACINVNGSKYHAKEGSLLCLYSHHFYNIHSILEKLDVVFVKFYIGLFSYMSWERHPKRANATLVYDTCPMVELKGDEKETVEKIIFMILKEVNERRFASLNILVYKTLELHSYYCRYAYEHVCYNNKDEDKIWNIIKRVILSTWKNLELKDIAKEENCSIRILNRNIKKATGYTFFQLQQVGKVLHACSLLHFPELSIEYITDLLGFTSVTSFYRVFTQYRNMSPRDYQKKYIGTEDKDYMGSGLVMQFLQYMHLNFMNNLTLEDLCEEFRIKPYTVKQLFDNIFGTSFKNILNEIRVSYATSFLKTEKYSILEVSLMCGFDSLSTFQRAFNEYMHQTPSQYKNHM